MNLNEKPSQFCPSFCEFVKHRRYECKLYTDCNHLKDREVTPQIVDVTICGQTNRVTIIGENEVFAPIWYLKEGTLPQILPKNYEVFSQVPEARKQKEIYDTKKKKERENRNKTHK